VAYDFSEQPANGGDWKFGSLSEAPNKVTCEVPQGSRLYDTPAPGRPDHARDLAIYPPGSRGSLRMTVTQGVANAGDQWRFGVDDHAKQFREGDEFWVCWRTRMNATYATWRFKATSNGSTWNGSYTDFKFAFWGYGMQFPYGVNGSPSTYYGYSPGANQINNVMQTAVTDVQGEIVMRSVSDTMNPGGPAGWMKYPSMYLGKFFDETVSKGQSINYYTYQNGGNEVSGAVKACQFQDPGGGAGNQYTDYSSCFILPTDEWFSLMTHVILGPQGAAPQFGSGPTRTGYTNSTVEYYGAYTGQPWRLLHRRTNVTLSTDSTHPGAQGVGRYGMFGWTTFMTGKWGGESHPDATVWVSQIILQPGSTMPAAPI